METEVKVRKARGEMVGKSTIDGITYEIFLDKGNFGLQRLGAFIQHVKAKTLRKVGIFSDEKKPRKIYGQFGVVGCQKN